MSKTTTKIKIPKGMPIKVAQTARHGTAFDARISVTANGQHRQVRKRFYDLDAAVDWVRDQQEAARRGTQLTPDQTSLDQLVTAWLASRDDVRQITKINYHSVLKPILRDHGHLRVQKITKTMIENWKADWPTTGGANRNGWSRTTIGYVLTALGALFDYAIDQKLIKENPARGIKPPRETLADQRKAAKRKVTAQVWTFAQLRRFVTTADTDELAAAWRLSACGLRRSEVLALTWDDIDLDGGVVSVGKGRVRDMIDKAKSDQSTRDINIESMLPGTLDKIRAHRAQQAQQLLALGIAVDGSTLIITNELGQPLHPDVYSQKFRRLSRDAKLPKIRLHALRHTIATELHDRGVAPATAAKLLGHTVGVHLASYVTSTQDHQDAAAAAFGEAFEASGS